MAIEGEIRSEMTDAMKSGDGRRRDIMRLLLASLQNARISSGHDLSDDEVIVVLQREAKQRRDSINEYIEGDREDLVRAEQEELDVIDVFLPESLTDDEVTEIARVVVAEMGATGPGDLGKVMGPLMGRVAGRADGGRVNQLVRELLTSA